jgi:hypothetical protein
MNMRNCMRKNRSTRFRSAPTIAVATTYAATRVGAMLVGVLLAGVILGAIPGTACGKTLEWNLQPDREYRWMIERTVQQTTRVTEWTESIRYQVAWQVTGRDSEDRMIITQRLLDVRHSLEYSGAAPVVYDSTQDAEIRGDATALARHWKPHFDTPRQLVLQSNGQIVRVDAKPDDKAAVNAAASPAATPPSVAPASGTRLMPPPSLQDGLFRLPDEDISPQHRWSETKAAPWQDQAEAVKLNVTYIYQGEEPAEQQSLDRIETLVQWEILPEADGSLPIVLERQAGSGAIYFDAQQGHVARSETSMKLVAWLRREAGDSQVVEIVVDQKLRFVPAAPVPDAAAKQ